MYDFIATKYDSFYKGVEDEKENKEIRDLLGKYIQGTILDIGSGTGLFCGLFPKMEEEYLGVDISQAMVQVAREKYPEWNFKVDSVQYLAGSFNSIISLSRSDYL